MHMLDRKYGININKTDVLEQETKNRIHLSLKAREVINQIKIPTIVAGDFNMPIESIIYQKHWRDLLNAFSETGKGYGWSTEDYIKNISLNIRVDHIISCREAIPLTSATGNNVGSDHLPIISDICY